MNNDLVPRKNADIAPYDYGEFAGDGFDNVTPDDLTPPFLYLLQTKSAQVENDDPPGAEGGKFFSKATGELFDEVRFVPCVTQQSYVEWMDHEIHGLGKFVGTHLPDSPIIAKIKAEQGRFGKKKMPNGNDLIQTFVLYALIIDENDEFIGQAMIPITSKKITPYSKFISACYKHARGVPLYAIRGILSSAKETAKGFTFFNVRFNFVGDSVADSLLPPDSPLLPIGKALKDAVTGGLVKTDFAKTSEPSGEAAPTDVV